MGGAGFIGSHLADELLQDGHDVRIYDSLLPPVHGEGGMWPAYLAAAVACPASSLHDQRDPVQTLKTCVQGSIDLPGLAKRLHIPILLSRPRGSTAIRRSARELAMERKPAHYLGQPDHSDNSKPVLLPLTVALTDKDTAVPDGRHPEVFPGGAVL